MRFYTVHVRPEAPSADPDVIFVKEGFCWPALLFPPVWLLWRRQWLGLLAYLSGALLVGGVGALFDFTDVFSAILFTTFSITVAVQANDWQRWRLERRGYRLLTIVRGATLEEAEETLFHEDRVAAPRPATGARPAARTASVTPASLDPLMP